VDVVIPHDFVPRVYQQEYFDYYDAGGKRGMWCWHRRGGKDLTAANQECKQAHLRIGPYWHFFPTLEQGRRALWEAFRKDGKRSLETVFPGFTDPRSAGSIVARKNEQQMMLELKVGSIWRIMGTDKLESVGAGPVHVTFSEFSLCRPSAWDYVRPMLRENGGSASFIFTPRGRNHAHKMFELAKKRPGWRTSTKTVENTNLTFESEEDPERRLSWAEMVEEERASGMEESLIQQEYFCDFSAAMVGSYWGDLVNRLDQMGAIWDFEHEKDGVQVFFDLGISDSTAMWAARENGAGGLDFLNYYEYAGKPVSHAVNKLVEWAAQLGYKYIKFWLPHDARNRSIGDGLTTLAQFVKHCKTVGWEEKMVSISPEESVQDGIEAVRWLLQQPTRIHTRCEKHDGVELLRQYHRHYDEDKRVFAEAPEHDWTSHGADGLRYGALVAKTVMRLGIKARRQKAPVQLEARPLDRSVTMNELVKANERKLRRRAGRGIR
jgi:phage terminase large subunit